MSGLGRGITLLAGNELGVILQNFSGGIFTWLVFILTLEAAAPKERSTHSVYQKRAWRLEHTVLLRYSTILGLFLLILCCLNHRQAPLSSHNMFTKPCKQSSWPSLRVQAWVPFFQKASQDYCPTWLPFFFQKQQEAQKGCCFIRVFLTPSLFYFQRGYYLHLNLYTTVEGR